MAIHFSSLSIFQKLYYLLFPKELDVTCHSIKTVFRLYLLGSTLLFFTLILLLFIDAVWETLSPLGMLIAFLVYLMNLVLFMATNNSFANFILSVIHDKAIYIQQRFCGLFIIFFICSATLFIGSGQILHHFSKQTSIFSVCGCIRTTLDGVTIKTIN
jgi:hypothetical protein